jgi:hypothetical protein
VRLTLATVVLLAMLGFAAWSLLMRGPDLGEAARAVTVAQAVGDPALVGRRVEVRGYIAAIEKRATRRTPYWRLAIVGSASPRLAVVIPAAVMRRAVADVADIGDGLTVTLLGTLQPGPVLVADDGYLRTGPAKRTSVQPMPVGVLVTVRDRVVGLPIQLEGVVATESINPQKEAFALASRDGRASVLVSLPQRLWSPVRPGAAVVVSGSLGKNDVFTGTSVRPAGKGRS